MSKTIEELFEHQKKWSAETFGDHLDPSGVIDHIHKEIEEIRAAPDDPEEWADLFILAMDGLWRSGREFNQKQLEMTMTEFSPAILGVHDTLRRVGFALDRSDYIFIMAVASCMLLNIGILPRNVVHAKQQKNAARKWPDKSTVDITKAIEHVSEGQLSPDDNSVKTGLSDRERRLMLAAYESGQESRKSFRDWLDEVVSDGGHTVEEYVSSTYWDRKSDSEVV